jgi:hypothetical protein
MIAGARLGSIEVRPIFDVPYASSDTGASGG